MARKVFVSYKHKDSGVRMIPGISQFETITARHYVDKLCDYLDAEDHIYKGEGNEDLGSFKDDTIESKLKEKIFDSSVTIVLISKNMKDTTLPEEDQWIPWEVSYSLREKTKDGRTSVTNAFLAVVIPDENSSYEYFVKESGCPHCNSTTWYHDNLFKIIGKNMFNKKRPNKIVCRGENCRTEVHTDSDHSYIHPVKWDDFVGNINYYLDHATKISDSIEEYNIVKSLTAV
jgi:hypothetical protein